MKLIRNECVAAIFLLSILELTQSSEPKIALVNLGKNLNLELVLIPSGKFTMGSPEDEKGRSNNETLHEVTLSKSFYLGKYEVTQEQWEALMGNNPSSNKGAKLPVTDVTWNDCQEFIKKLNANTKGGYRLPTEAEWEYAARGGLERQPYSWGSESPFEGKPRANIWQGPFPNRDDKTDGFGGTAPVKSYPANGYGLYDVSGNVWEWCADWYRPDAYSLLYRGLDSDALKIPLLNPKGPASPIDPHGNEAKVRVQRGGSFLCSSNYCVRYRVGLRMHGAEDTGLSHTGFRCVLDP